MFRKLLALLTGWDPAPVPIDAASWRTLLAELPLLRALSPSEQQQLHQLSARFLADKHFYGADGLEIDDGMMLRVAALACLPVLALGYDWLDAIREVVLYPDLFIVHHREVDELGFVHEGSATLSGEAWDFGTLVLAWPEVQQAGQRHDAYNVVIHEVAHVLDNRNGAFNGFPPLPAGMDRARWTADFSAAFDTLNRQLDADLEPQIDPYAATAPTEFFAVTSEYHFERPDLLRQAFPAVARQLARFYAGGKDKDKDTDGIGQAR